MEPRMAAKAAKSVRVKLAIPQHYGTFPGISENVGVFASEAKKLGVPYYEMKPGETISFRGRQMMQKK